MFGLAAILAAFCLLWAPGALAQEPVKQFQQLLSDRGCDVGAADGQWGKRTTAAAEILSQRTGIGIERPVTSELLQRLEANPSGCAPAAGTAAASALLDLFLPADVKAGFDIVPQSRRAQLCPVRSLKLEILRRTEPSDALTGLTSSMANSMDVPAFVALDQFSISVADLTSAAWAGGNDKVKRELVERLAAWAESGAYLKTVNCSDGGCAQPWQTERGTDLSPDKDSDSVLERVYSIALAYYAMLADFEPDTMARQHREIDSWLKAFGKRLRNSGNPINVYVGFGMGWGWSNLLYDTLSGRTDRVEQRMDLLAEQMDDWLLDDGSIRERTTRGSRAIWYHFSTLNEFFVTLELLRANGRDVYPRYEERLHKAVDIFLNALDDPKSISPWASVGYRSAGDPGEIPDFREDLQHASYGSSWLSIYPMRYPEHASARRLVEVLKSMPVLPSSDSQLGLGLHCLYRASIPTLAPPGMLEPIKDFEVAKVYIRADDGSDKFLSHRITMSGARVGGKLVKVPIMDLNRGFDFGSSDNPTDISLFRYMFMRSKLVDTQSQVADYSGCDDIAVQVLDYGEQELRLHIGYESEQNECILSKMGPTDRMIWESIVSDFGAVLDVAPDRPDVQHIRQSYEHMTR